MKNNPTALFTTILIIAFQCILPVNVFSQPRVADGHIHHGIIKEGREIRFSGREYFYSRGIQAFSFPLPAGREDTRNLYSLIASEIGELKKISRADDNFRLWKDGARNRTEKVITIIPSIEYFSGVFNHDPSLVLKYKELGICFITLVDNKKDKFFSGDDLTEFGKDVIRMMNGARVIIDITHLSRAQRKIVLQFSGAPVLVSHTNADALAELDYNLSDRELELMKANGGLVLVSFNANGLFVENGQDSAGVRRVAENISYLAGKLGVKSVGIGSDYQAGGRYVAGGLNSPDVFVRLREELIKRGFSSRNVEDIFYNNFINFIGKGS